MGHGNDTLAEPTCLDKGRGNWHKRRFLILSIFSTHVFTSGRDSAGGVSWSCSTPSPRYIVGRGRTVSHWQERGAGRRKTGFCLDLGSRDRSPSLQSTNRRHLDRGASPRGTGSRVGRST